ESPQGRNTLAQGGIGVLKTRLFSASTRAVKKVARVEVVAALGIHAPGRSLVRSDTRRSRNG
ncbi:MAG TPA: hypothetical protein VEL77_03490, partial [Rugosimonospora sp.]|nr:hypothetical protein [Rugosimonospora sp.]